MHRAELAAAARSPPALPAEIGAQLPAAHQRAPALVRLLAGPVHLAVLRPSSPPPGHSISGQSMVQHDQIYAIPKLMSIRNCHEHGQMQL